VDVKTGAAPLDPRQKQIRDRIHQGKIKHKVLK
jgi:predicted Holliday junction resolvase-like endonuclease